MRRHLSTLIEVGGAAALTYGVYIALGTAASLITGGVLGILFGVALDLPRGRRAR